MCREQRENKVPLAMLKTGLEERLKTLPVLRKMSDTFQRLASLALRQHLTPSLDFHLIFLVLILITAASLSSPCHLLKFFTIAEAPFQEVPPEVSLVLSCGTSRMQDHQLFACNTERF